MEKDKKNEAALAKKIPSSFTILAILTLLVGVATWIIPAGRYDTESVSTSAGDKEIAIKGTYKSAEDRVSEAKTNLEQVKAEYGITDARLEEANEKIEAAAAEEATESQKLEAEALAEDPGIVATNEAQAEVEAAKEIRKPQGLWEALLAPIKGTKEVVDIIVVVLFVGGLLALEAKVGAIQAGFQVLMKRMKGREKWLIPMLIALFAVCGSAYGSQEETVVYYAFMVPLMMAAGYNAMTALMTVIVGTSVGIAASTVNPFSAMIAAEVGGGKVGDGMLTRTIMLIVGVIIGSYFVVKYAEAVKAGKHKEDSVNDSKLKFAKATTGDDKLDAKRKATLVIIFMTLIGITILAFIPWNTLGIDFFVNAQEAVYNIPVIGKIIGNVTPFGGWYFDELGVLYLVAALALGFMYKIGDREFVDIFIDGAKDVLGVCLIIGVARGITVVMNDGNITHTILYWFESALSNLPEGAVKGLFGGVLYIIYLPLAFLIPSTSGLASVSMPIFGQLAGITGVGIHIAVAAFVAGSGIIQMVAPTVGSLMGGAVACGVSYTKYLKRVGGLFIALSIAYILIITIASVTGFAL